VIGQLDEICVMFKQKKDDALQLAGLVSRALWRLRVAAKGRV
jgi:hypothetical protein